MRGPPHSSAIIASEDSEKPNDWINRLYYFGIPSPALPPSIEVQQSDRCLNQGASAPAR